MIIIYNPVPIKPGAWDGIPQNVQTLWGIKWSESCRIISILGPHCEEGKKMPNRWLAGWDFQQGTFGINQGTFGIIQGTFTFIMVALRCNDRRQSFSFASATVALMNTRSLAAFIVVLSTISPSCNQIWPNKWLIGQDFFQRTSGIIQGTFGIIQETFGINQGTFGIIRGKFGIIQGTFGAIQATFGISQATFGIIQGTLGIIHHHSPSFTIIHRPNVRHHSGNVWHNSGNVWQH
jgi:hypothetical protein